jgi:hypothetical protein
MIYVYLFKTFKTLGAGEEHVRWITMWESDLDKVLKGNRGVHVVNRTSKGNYRVRWKLCR